MGFERLTSGNSLSVALHTTSRGTLVTRTRSMPCALRAAFWVSMVRSSATTTSSETAREVRGVRFMCVTGSFLSQSAILSSGDI